MSKTSEIQSSDFIRAVESADFLAVFAPQSCIAFTVERNALILKAKQGNEFFWRVETTANGTNVLYIL
jgi:hypothetical protein